MKRKEEVNDGRISTESRLSRRRFLSIKEQFDTSTATGEMMVFNMINLAQFERKQTSERVTMNFHARALRGLTNGSPAPLGYKRNPERPGGLVVDELEANQVRRVFEVFLEEGSLKKTVAKLNVEGIRPKVTANKSHFQAGRGKWTACGLLYLLRSPTYIGMRAVNRKHQHKDQSLLRSYEIFQLVKGAWPAIVDEIVFDEVQYELDKNRTRRALGPRGRNFPLTGILKCQECGDGFNGASSHGRGGVHRYYMHRDAYKRRIGCKIRRIRAGKTEDAILPSLGRIIHRLGYFETARGKVDELIGNRLEGLKPQENRVKEELLRIDREIGHALRLEKGASGEFSLGDVILSHLKKLKDDRDNLEKTLHEIRRHMESAQELNVDWDSDTGLMSKFNRGWKILKPFQQRRILHRVFREIVVSAEGFRIVCWTAPKAEIENQSEISGGTA